MTAGKKKRRRTNKGVISSGVAEVQKLQELQTNELGAAEAGADVAGADESMEYFGTPYADIVKKWWEVTNGGREPGESDCVSLTFGIARALRHICNHDRVKLDKVIPDYGGIDHETKMRQIDLAIKDRSKMIPRELMEVLRSFEKKETATTGEPSQLTAVLDDEENHFFEQLKSVPMGIRDSIEAVGPALAFPVLASVAACIGALATGVRLEVHQDPKGLNLIVMVVGESASGKGCIGPITDTWMHEVQEKDNKYLESEAQWRKEMRRAKNSDKQPKEEVFPIRIITLNNTIANLSDRLGHTNGLHAFSFTSEADEVAMKWGSGMTDFSTILRKAYDNDKYCREAKSADAVNVHIDQVFWNVVMCGTKGALYRVVRNYEDGFQNRLALASTPDNTFAPLEPIRRRLSQDNIINIHRIAHLLPLCKGQIDLPLLEAKGQEWLERVRITALMNDDEVMARQRMRICVTTQRIVCCMMLCSMLEKLVERMGTVEKAEGYMNQNGWAWAELLEEEQTEEMLDNFDLIADTMMNTNLYYFKTKLQSAMAEMANSLCLARNSEDARRSPLCESIYLNLPRQFAFADANAQSIAIKGYNVSSSNVAAMLRRWRKQGLVDYDAETKVYTKVG